MQFPDTLKAPYATIRPFIASGDILLCSGTAIFSKLIQHATNSLWSHVAFVLRLDTIDRILVLESVESIGVRATPLRQYVTNYNGGGQPYPGRLFLARHRHFPSTGIGRLSQQAIDLLGYPYDTQEILSIAARIVAVQIGLNPRTVRQNRTYICSEYAAECFQSIGLTISYNSAGFISPQDFAAAPEVEMLWEIEGEHA